MEAAADLRVGDWSEGEGKKGWDWVAKGRGVGRNRTFHLGGSGVAEPYSSLKILAWLT
jgi:hypothetical protein